MSDNGNGSEPAEDVHAKMARLRALAKKKQEERVSLGLPARGPRRPTVAEAREAALADLEPKALRVLRQQLDSANETIRHRAAVKLLEYRMGRPAQADKNQQRASEANVIRYETAAITRAVSDD